MYPEALYRIMTEDRAAERAEIEQFRQAQIKRPSISVNSEQKARQTLIRPLLRFMGWLLVAMIGTFLVGCDIQDSEEWTPGVMPVFAPALTPKLKSNPHISIYTLAGQLIASVSEPTQLERTMHRLPNGLYLGIRAYAGGRRELFKIGMRR